MEWNSDQSTQNSARVVGVGVGGGIGVVGVKGVGVDGWEV